MCVCGSFPFAATPKKRKKLRRRIFWTLIGLILLIGVLVGSVAYLVSFTIKHLSKWMRDPVQDLVQNGSIAQAYLLHSVWAVGLSLVAALLTLWAPQARARGGFIGWGLAV